MLRRSPILLFLCIFVLPVQANESLFTYDQFQDGLDIRSVEAHDQSRIWSTCAVVHELVAMMDDNGPDSASAKQSANQGNGVKLASGIVFIVDYFEENRCTRSSRLCEQVGDGQTGHGGKSQNYDD